MIIFAHSYFKQPPSAGKMAFDGRWEEEIIFEPGRFRTEAEAEEFLGEKREVACEAVFGDSLFGCRRTGDRKTLVAFIVGFGEAIAASQSGPELFEAMRRRLNVPIASHFTFAEVGAVGAWKSVGPFRIASPQAALEDFERTCVELGQSSVSQDKQHLKALEFAFDNRDGTTHWIALPVSDGATIVPGKLKVALESFVHNDGSFS